MTNPTSIVINRPYGEPTHLRTKGVPQLMEDGSVSVTCFDDKNRKYWIAIAPVMLQRMLQTYEASQPDTKAAVQFERLLSHRQPGQDLCIRDAVFDYFCGILHDTDKANAATKQFTDQLFACFKGPGRSTAAPAA